MDIQFANRYRNKHKDIVVFGVRKGENTLFECFGNYPEIQEKCKKVWSLLAKIDTFVSKRDPSDEEIEEGAKDCESFCNIFPPLFEIKILHQRCSF